MFCLVLDRSFLFHLFFFPLFGGPPEPFPELFLDLVLCPELLFELETILALFAVFLILFPTFLTNCLALFLIELGLLFFGDRRLLLLCFGDFDFLVAGFWA